MKSKITSLLSSLILTVTFILFSAVPCAECTEYTADEVDSLISGIISYKLSESGCGNVQDWINGKLTDDAGVMSEWYIITLSQNGYTDFSAYSDSLVRYLDSHNESSASSGLKYALALSASGSGNRYITDFLGSSAGKQGIMSWIYALHVMNNGYTAAEFDISSVISTLLSLQFSDGGWALFGEHGDIDVTAMTISALAPYYCERNDVHEACDRGIDFLSQRQLDDGGFQSFGTPNPESASQVLTALSSLGINCQYDSRFIKNENTVLDGIVKYRLDNGSFRHTEDGDSNDTATVQAMYAFTAYKRMVFGQGPLFIFDNRKPADTPSLPELNESSSSESATAVISTEISAATTGIPDAVEVTDTSAVSRVSDSSVTSHTNNITETVTSVSLSETVISSAESSGLSEIFTEHEVQNVMKQTDSEQSNRSGYKTTAVIIIISSGAVVCLILFLTGKRNYKNFIFVGIAAAVLTLFVILTDFQSAGSYYSQDIGDKENITGTVTLEIRCDTITGKSDSEHIPSDGTVLEKTEFAIEEGDTVFDILTEAARKNSIQIENKGSAGNTHGMVYIAGINYIYEFDFGDLSGWVYHVNGKAPSIGCGEYVLSDGDCIEWLYTCELGHDLDEVYE